MPSCAAVLERPVAFPAGLEALNRVIAALGSDMFTDALLNYLDDLCGAEHCAIYTYADGALMNVAAASVTPEPIAQTYARLYGAGRLWRQDPSLEFLRRGEATEAATLVRLDIERLGPGELRDRVYRPHHARDRVLLGSRIGGLTVLLSVIRTSARGSFNGDQLHLIDRVADNLLALAQRQIAIAGDVNRLGSALTSLAAIEGCIAMSHVRLARREADVCARILYGMTSPGIALDLKIGEESAMTYRKRAYHRLNIGSQRELLLWYLNQWSLQRGATALGCAH